MTANWIERLLQTEDGRRALEQERLIMQATEAIAMLMDEQQISRSELARRIGKSPAFITKLLRGNNNFTLRTLSDVFFALDCSAHLSLGKIGDGISLCSTSPTEPLRLDSSGWGEKVGSWGKKPKLGSQADSKDIAA